MNGKRTIKIALIAAGVVAALLVLSSPAMAQCAMCKTAVTGSPEAARLSQSLNFAVIVLLIPPVLIFCGIFVIAYRLHKSRGVELDSSSDGDVQRRKWFTKPVLNRKRKGGSKREAGGATA